MLATQVGSLPRLARAIELLGIYERAESADQPAYRTEIVAAVAEFVRAQVEHGIDVVSDVQSSGPIFMFYIRARISDFQPKPQVTSRWWLPSVRSETWTPWPHGSREAIEPAPKETRPGASWSSKRSSTSARSSTAPAATHAVGPLRKGVEWEAIG